MTAKELLQQIIDGTAGEYVRYAPVDLVKACALMARIEQDEDTRPDPDHDLYDALQRSAEALNSMEPEDDDMREEYDFSQARRNPYVQPDPEEE